jgi:spermidine/putrescine transport system ATP-binding protein
VELKRVQVEVGITFVYVTHDQEEALALSDRIAVMNRGRIEQLGTPEELYDRPRSRFVADFIGTSNLLTGSVLSVVDGIAEVALEGGGRCLARANGLAPGATAEISVRPEALALAPVSTVGGVEGGPGQATGSWLRGTVEQSAYLGTSISYQVRAAGGQLVVASLPRTQERLATGSPVEIRWRPDDALILGGPAMVDNDKEEPR